MPGALLIATACGSGGAAGDGSSPAPTTPAVPAVAAVQVTAASPQIVVGGRSQLAIVVTDTRGNAVTGRPVQWSSNSPTVATIDDSAGARGVGVGTATLTATVDGRSGSAAVTVLPGGVTGLRLTPVAVTLPVGGAQVFTVVALDTLGGTIAAPALAWAASPAAVVSVGGDGVVRGRGAGSGVVTVSANGHAASATISVTPAPVGQVVVTAPAAQLTVGASLGLTATVRDTTGGVVTDRPVTWSSSAPAVATVDATGLVRGGSPGAVTITATAGGRAGTVALQVVPTPAASVQVTPTAPSVGIGSTVVLTAVPRDALGNLLTGRDVAWSSADSTIASVATSGLVTGRKAGTTAVRATVDGVVGSAAVTVTSPATVFALTVVSGNGQTGFVGATLPTAPSVALVDGTGRGIPGVTVTFAVTMGGGSLSGITATTNASGVATAGSWTLGPLAGGNAVTASARAPTGTQLSATFSATAITSTPPRQCCKVCTTGKPCGDTCIAATSTCHTVGGCACAVSLGVVGPSVDAARTYAAMRGLAPRRYPALTVDAPLTLCTTRLASLVASVSGDWLRGG